MRLAGLLAEGHICTDLEAQQRDDAVHELLSQLEAAGKLDERQVADALKAVIQREALGTTAIGHGMAVPHARIEGITDTVLALGLSRAGVEFNALDHEPVRAIFLVIGSQDDPEQYLDVMRRISTLIQNEDFRRFLPRARGAAEVVDLVAEMGQ